MAVHEGHYSGLAEATSDVAAWVDANGELVGAPYEVYLDNHDEVPLERLRTEIVWPIKLR